MGIRSTGESGRGCDCDLAVQLLAPAFPSGTSGLTLAYITWSHLIVNDSTVEAWQLRQQSGIQA